MLDVVVGFDAGGTSTQCALMTLDGVVLGTGTAGPGNFQLVREDGIRNVLKEAYESALSAAGVSIRVHAAFVGMAGASSRRDRERIAAVAQELGIAPLWRVTGDMVPALAAGTQGREGIVIVAGTGSICWGCDASGVSARAGGWGYLLGDEGSGFSIGQRGAMAALRAFDGRGPKTSLTHRIVHALGCAGVDELVGCIYREKAPRPLIASLAPVVIDAANDGDAVANEILADAAREHVQAILAVYRVLHFDGEVPVVASGGLFSANDELARRVRHELAPLLPVAKLIRPEVEPVIGACYLAVRAAQGDVWPPHE